MNTLSEPKPTFIIIGAARSGTTSLYHYLNQHPDIYMSPIKETNFFANTPELKAVNISLPYDLFVKSAEDYRACFEKGVGALARGEASPSYFYHPSVPQKIKSALPDIKLIAILRNPVERAFSSYQFYSLKGLETRTFQQAVAEELAFFETHQLYPLGRNRHIGTGMYVEHLERYFSVFGRDRVLVLWYQDLKNSPQALMSQVYRFVGVPEAPQIDTSIQYNASGRPASPLGRVLASSSPWKKRVRQLLPQSILYSVDRWYMKRRNQEIRPVPMDQNMRARLTEVYRPDILRLQGLMGRDLSSWLEGENTQ